MVRRYTGFSEATSASLQKRQKCCTAPNDAKGMSGHQSVYSNAKMRLPVILHAHDGPAFVAGLVVERLGEGADLGVRHSLCRAVSVFALRVIVQEDHRKARAAARLRPFEHLTVAG